ncbi:hypothetical protein BJF78_14495 [Pseudonocardia sp. CNS-139]|nr:hypothetical protein BJF78_14495 [Pseudonocardia sp. CNS-139]
MRRRAILDVAQDMLATTPVEEISLRALSRRAGLASSNVLRYFGSRETIFLEVVDRLWTRWLDDLQERLAGLGPAPDRPDVARTVAASLAAHPQFCELVSVQSSVLERNASVEDIVSFKRRALAHRDRTASLVAGAVPGLGERAARELTSLTTTFVAGLWPLANPGPAVAAATATPDLAAAHVDFTTRLTRMLDLLITALRDGEAG